MAVIMNGIQVNLGKAACSTDSIYLVFSFLDAVPFKFVK